jgi:hypothetical protein
MRLCLSWLSYNVCVAGQVGDSPGQNVILAGAGRPGRAAGEKRDRSDRPGDPRGGG